MNAEDLMMLTRIAERVASSTLAPLDALKGAYALGITRETMEHARRPQDLPAKPLSA